MKISCNGCRVLRKGCPAGCSIRPCLQGMGSSESQSNATLFLAKFYGRTGLINRIGSGPEQLRPAIFRSLLYEACGRIVNPIHGSVGLMRTGNWHVCEAAVESVLDGRPIAAIPNFQAYDIRHVPKNPGTPTPRCQVIKNRARFKRSAQPRPGSAGPAATSEDSEDTADALLANENVVELGLDLELRLAPPGAPRCDIPVDCPCRLREQS